MAKVRSFQYSRRTADDIKERVNMRGGNFDDFIKQQYKRYKAKDGKNLIRILPPTWEKARHYGLDIHVNYGIGADNQAYLSLSKMKGEKDPLAEARREAENEGNEKVAKALKPTHRILVWLIDRTAEDEGPQLWAEPFSFDKSLNTLSIDEDTKDVVYIDDPEEGCDVRFYKEGQAMLTKYPPEKIKLLPARLHEDERKETAWLQYVTENPLTEVLQYFDYDHIASVFNGHVRTDTDEEPTPPRRTAPKPDADQEAEAPVRRSRPRVQVVDPEDEPPFEDPQPRRGRTPPPAEEVENSDSEIAGSIRERLERSRKASRGRFQEPEED